MRQAVLILLLAALAACSDEVPPTVSAVPPGGEVTFLVAADTHFGVEGMAEANERQIDAMNSLPGIPWPEGIGGTVGTPLALLVCGDLTDHGRTDEWAEFVAHYGRTGTDGRVRYPVFESTGNHDRWNMLYRPVLLSVARRHGGLVYAFDLGELRVICLDEYPNAARLAWLREELARVGPSRPVVIYFHFAFTGPLSDWWEEAEKDAFRAAVEGYRIVAVFHGHYHGSGHYEWRGLDVYNVGSPRYIDRSFGVARWKDGRFAVASFDWSESRWTWSHVR